MSRPSRTTSKSACSTNTAPSSTCRAASPRSPRRFSRTKAGAAIPNSFVTWWRRTHFENSMIDALLHREHTPYREIGHRAVAHVMDRAGINYSQGRRPLSRRRDRKAEAVSGSAGGAGQAAHQIQARRALQRRSRHAGDRQAISQGAVRPRDLGRRGEFLQAACRDLHQGRRTARTEARPDPVRRQPRLRLHRRQIGRHEDRLHRPPQPAVRRNPASAGYSGAEHEGSRRREV